MIDQSFRKILPKFSGPLLKVYRKFNLAPNHLTWLGFSFACFAAVCVAFKLYIFGALLWWVGRVFDGTDGLWARTIGQTSLYGAYLDIVLDMAAYSIMVIGFAVAFPQLKFIWIAILFLYVLCITSALAMGDVQTQLVNSGKISIKQDNRGLSLASGLAEAGETGIAYTLFLLFPTHINWLASLWIVILTITVVARTLMVRRLAKSD